MKKIYLVSLGCSKNLVDSERFLYSSVSNLNLEPTTDPTEADFILINTCGFLSSAVEEAIETIMDLGSIKNSNSKMAVIGCLPSRYMINASNDLLSGLPEVDLWLTPSDYHKFESSVAKLLNIKMKHDLTSFSKEIIPVGQRLLGTPPFRSFLKIAEGCNNHCTYCLIPKLRGPLVSYQADDLIKESEILAAGGVKEITLVAQDLTAYGLDTNKPDALLKLIKRISTINDITWIRLLYAYPERLTESLIKNLSSIPKVIPYLDIPFQHVSDGILKHMGRRSSTKPLDLIKNLRKWWPEISLRTTLIVGFPGETEKHFNELEHFVSEASFDNLGVFKFSPEPEAAASKMHDQVPQIIKEKRRRKIMALQRKISRDNNKKRKGNVFKVIVEGPSDSDGFIMSGRAYFQAPEVDGLIYFEGDQPEAGSIVDTLITKSSDYDLIGRIL